MTTKAKPRPKVMKPPKIGRLVQREQHFMLGVFGESGSGKSTSQTTAVPEDKQEELLIVNVDHSLNTISGNFSIYPDPMENRPVQSWQEVLDLVTWLELEGHKQFPIVSFDTATEMGALLKAWILSQEPRVGRRPSADRMNQDDYGWYADEYLALLRRIRDLPMHVIMLMQAVDQEYQTPEGQTQLIRYPSFGEGRKTNAEANQFFDLMGYLSVVRDNKNNIKRSLLVYPLGNRKAKVRTRPGVEAPLAFDNPNLHNIMRDYMLAEGKGGGKS